MYPSTTFEVTRLGQGLWSLSASTPHRGDLFTALIERGTAEAAGAEGTITLETNSLIIVPRERFGMLTVHRDSLVVAAWLSASDSEPPVSGSGIIATARPGTTTGVMRHVMLGLSNDAHAGVSAYSPRVCQQFAALIAAVQVEHAHNVNHGAAAILRNAQDFIEGRLFDTDLGQEQIAAALNVSTRTLHRAFHSQGCTIGEWIRERRLEQCRIDLEDSRLDHIPVSVLAAHWGLTDAAHFSRQFKLRYGMPPRSFRAQSTSGSAIPSRSAHLAEQLQIAG